jgi:hypothetical protein
MSELQNRMLVQHASLGVGKVVALEPNAVHVFFPESDKRFAVKLRLPAAAPLLRTEGIPPNSWLEGLSDFSLDAKSGRYALAATWLTHDQAIAQFMATYPAGFEDPSFFQADDAKGERASRWRAAHDAWVAALGDGAGEKLLADDGVKEVAKRALKAVKQVSAFAVADDEALSNALADVEAAAPYFEALFEVLAAPAPGRARYEKLFAAALALPGPDGSKWAFATLFAFVAQPERNVFLRPKAACDAAARLGCDLKYDETPNWATFSALRAFSTQLLATLKANGARDFIDVECFLHAIVGKKVPAVKSADGAAPKKPRAAPKARATAAGSGR